MDGEIGEWNTRRQHVWLDDSPYLSTLLQLGPDFVQVQNLVSPGTFARAFAFQSQGYYEIYIDLDRACDGAYPLPL